MKTVGILGGLGPLAGAYFYLRLCELTPASGDEDHLPVVLDSDPEVPSRVNHLSGQGPSPLPALRALAGRLVECGADFVVMPSSTTSYYLPEIRASLSVPMLSIVEEVAANVHQVGIQRLGVLGTTPTRTYHLYDATLASRDVAVVYPDDKSQQDTMDLIWAVKTSMMDQPGSVSTPSRSDVLVDILGRAWARDVDAILLACTELPVVGRFLLTTSAPKPILHSTDILARAAIAFATS